MIAAAPSRRRSLGRFLLVGATNSANELAAFGRTLIVARMIGPDEMGVAVMLAILIRLAEMAVELGSDRFLVQAPPDRVAALQANAHGLSLLKGLLAAALVAVAAWPLAAVFDITHAAPVLAAGGLILFFRSAAHLDFRRVQRAGRFREAAWVEAGSSVISLAMTWPIVWLVGDFSALVWATMAQAVLYCLIAHLVAETPFRVAFARAEMGELLRFGLPLAANGILMYLVLQGDRVIVAGWFPPADVARFSLLVQLVLMPVLICARMVLTLDLPAMARLKGDPRALRTRTLKSGALALAAAATGLSIMAWQGPAIMAFIYGPVYAPAALLATLVTAAAAIRLVRAVPTTVSLAHADSAALLKANLLRGAGVGIALILAATGFGLVAIVTAGLVAEALAFAAAIHFALRRIGRFPAATPLAPLPSGA